MKKRILVTGSSGFIGSALLPALEARGFETFGFDLQDGDISRAALPFHDVQHVLHLAARTFVPDSWKDPLGFYQVNVMGTANVLEFCRREGCPVTLMSSYIYGPPRKLPLDENQPVEPNSPYNHSKAIVESLGKFYAEKFGLAVTILRPFNIYGPGQPPSFLIPSLVSQALDPGVETIEVADLEPKRDYLYRDDLVNAILATLRPAAGCAVYNLGSGQSLSVAQVIQAVQAAAGTHKAVHSRQERRPGEVMDTVADIRRARLELDWKPRVSFEEGIARVVAAARAAKEAVR